MRTGLRRIVGALLLAGASSVTAYGQETAPEPELFDQERRELLKPKPETKLLTVQGVVHGGLQWIAKSPTSQGSVFASGSLDLNVTLRPWEWLDVFLDVEGLAGLGPDRRLGTLARLNNDADRLDGRDEKIVVRELFLAFSWLEERLRLNVGKLDVNQYFDRNAFAQDETSQFLAGALVQNPMGRTPPNSPGAVLRASDGEWRYVFGVFAPDDLGQPMHGLPYIIGEVGRRNPSTLHGHYRWWARVGSEADDPGRVTWGTGISVDQFLTDDLGVFLRAGLSRTQHEPVTSYAWSLGLQYKPTPIGRERDVFGVGYSEQREPEGRERFVEAYYRFAVTDWSFLIANVQWVVHGPNQVTGGTNRNVVVPGLRVLILF